MQHVFIDWPFHIESENIRSHRFHRRFSHWVILNDFYIDEFQQKKIQPKFWFVFFPTSVSWRKNRNIQKRLFLVSQYAVTAKSECNTFPTYQWWNGRWIFLYIFSCFLCRFLLMSTSTAKSEDFFFQNFSSDHRAMCIRSALMQLCYQRRNRI